MKAGWAARRRFSLRQAPSRWPCPKDKARCPMTTNRCVANRATSSDRQALDREGQFAHRPADEHIATPVQIEAQKLLEDAGSPELAKHAVDVAAIGRGEGSPQDQFARRLGFASYLSL